MHCINSAVGRRREVESDVVCDSVKTVAYIMYATQQAHNVKNRSTTIILIIAAQMYSHAIILQLFESPFKTNTSRKELREQCNLHVAIM